MAEDLPKDCRKAVSNWTADEFYVYFRPTTSCYLHPSKPHEIVWNVLVEFRAVDWQQWRASGPSLVECIRELDEKIPRRKKLQPGFKPSGKDGRANWLGPFAPAGPLATNVSIEAVADRARAEAKAKLQRKIAKAKK